MISKILHFTWKTADLPRQLQPYLDSWRRTHPGWDIRLWTDATMRALVAERYPELLSTYDGYPHNIQRADCFRYVVLHAIGGVYADLDVRAFHPIDALLPLDCFVGIEPFEHVGPDHRDIGVRYLLSNAFMGSVPGHPFWRQVLDLAPETAHSPIFMSTGPLFLLGCALRATPENRPVGLLPQVWSPHRDGGKPAHPDAAIEKLIERRFRIWAGDRHPLVSHEWLTTWVPWHVKHPGWRISFEWPTRLKWWWRKRRHPEIANVALPITPSIFDDQQLDRETRQDRIYVAVHAPDGGRFDPAIAKALDALDYPRERLTIALHATSSDAPGLSETQQALDSRFGPVPVVIDPGASAAKRNAMLTTGAKTHDRILLVESDVAKIPADALAKMGASGRDIVVAAAAGGDPRTWFYYGRPLFRYVYKQGGQRGAMDPNRPGKEDPTRWPIFKLLPVDGVSPRFLLLSTAAINAGVRFAEVPYKFHLDGDGLALKAKDLGFDAAIRNDVVVS